MRVHVCVMCGTHMQRETREQEEFTPISGPEGRRRGGTSGHKDEPEEQHTVLMFALSRLGFVCAECAESDTKPLECSLLLLL